MLTCLLNLIKNLSLKSGVYTWQTGEQYIGSFNQNNQFEGKGTLLKKEETSSFILSSNFKNGYPGEKSIFKIKKDKEYDIYIESDIKKEEKKGEILLILDGRTNITKKENGKEIYRFDGELENGIIKNNASIKRKFKNNRYVDDEKNDEENEEFIEVKEEENKEPIQEKQQEKP